MRILTIAPLVAALLLAGCTGGGGSQLSDAEARDVAEKAMQDFAQDFTSGEGPIRIIEGEFEVDDESIGTATVELRMERGRDDALQVELAMSGSGLTFALDMFCSPDIEVMSWGDNTYASRPSVEEPCQGALQQDEGLDVEGLEDSEIDEVEANDDGSVSATFTSETGEFAIETDPDGRLVRIEIESPEGSGHFDVKYGTKRSLEAPEFDTRAPAEILFDNSTQDGTETWTVTSSPQQPLIQELEMRFEIDGEPVAAMPLQDEEKASGSFTFVFDDVDDDGRLTEGDVLTFTAPSDSTAVPVLYDSWAGVNVGENPIPGLGFAAVAGALLLAGVVHRRIR